MNTEYQSAPNTDHLASLPAGFDPGSRVWIYQGHRPFTSEEAAQTRLLLDSFVRSWQSHGTPVKGFGALLYNQFIILLADESKESGASGVSGCSTDSSVHLIKQIEQQTDIRLFDRLNLAFYVGRRVVLIPITQFPEALSLGAITPDTLYFNNTIQAKEELETKWIIPLNDSWLGVKYLSRPAPHSATHAK
jgi:hypothetical protein